MRRHPQRARRRRCVGGRVVRRHHVGDALCGDGGGRPVRLHAQRRAHDLQQQRGERLERVPQVLSVARGAIATLYIRSSVRWGLGPAVRDPARERVACRSLTFNTRLIRDIRPPPSRERGKSRPKKTTKATKAHLAVCTQAGHGLVRPHALARPHARAKAAAVEAAPHALVVAHVGATRRDAVHLSEARLRLAVLRHVAGPQPAAH